MKYNVKKRTKEELLKTFSALTAEIEENRNFGIATPKLVWVKARAIHTHLRICYGLSTDDIYKITDNKAVLVW